MGIKKIYIFIFEFIVITIALIKSRPESNQNFKFINTLFYDNKLCINKCF